MLSVYITKPVAVNPICSGIAEYKISASNVLEVYHISPKNARALWGMQVAAREPGCLLNTNSVLAQYRWRQVADSRPLRAQPRDRQK